MVEIFVSLGAWLESHNGSVTAFATVVIAVFTVVLASVTARQAKLTAIAADAARKSAEALPKIERAYLFLDEVVSVIEWPTIKSQKTDDSEIRLSFKNHGRTPAILKEMYWDVICNAYLPTVRDVEGLPGGPFPQSAIVAAGECSGFYSHNFAIEGRLTDDIALGRELMCLVGRIVYENVLGERCETGFCRQYREKTKSFDAAVSDKLNYYT